MPFWFPKKDNAIVYVVFIGIFLLSLDFWGWDVVTPMFFGMPLWVYYLIFLTLATSVFYWIIATNLWGNER